jgi:hypothetical protein
MNLSYVSARSWLWLFPITYLIHMLEEYYGGEGYTAHLLRTRGVYMSPTRFWVSQAIGTALMLLGVVLARKFNFTNAMIIIMGTIVLVNASTHIVNSLRLLEYEPGLLSSIIVWMPLGLFILLKFKRWVLNQRLYWIGIGIGLLINVAIAIFSRRGGRLF